MVKQLLLLVLLFCLVAPANSQQQLSLKIVRAAMDSAITNAPGEKLYLQFDKPSYLLGDTVWFKAYIFNASFSTPSAQSGILYVDVAGDDDKVIQEFMLPVTAGVSWGNLHLNKTDFAAGNYTLRAYTRWMRNLGDNTFFYHHFSIAGNNANTTLVNTRTQVFTVNNNDSVKTTLQFSTLYKQPLANAQLHLTVAKGRKTLLRNNITTNQAGIANISFTLPGKPLQVSLTAEDKTTGSTTFIPLALTRPENIDVQFMPEGGSLIAGIPAHVGFKAVGEDGRSVNITGVVVNSSNTQVAAFASFHKGMGTVDITPSAGEQYTARVSLPNGNIKSFALPAVQKDGICLQVQNSLTDDSVELLITATPGFIQSNGGNVLLVAQASNVFCYGAVLHMQQQNIVKRRLAKNLFPTGIAQLTVLALNGQPLSQRLTFIKGRQNMQVNVTTSKQVYHPRDSIAVALLVKDEDSSLLAGNFSMSVTDDAQVKTDEPYKQNIATSVIFSQNLKGYIEEPAWYLQQFDSTVWQALDNLLLTQGWISYNLQKVLNHVAPAYLPEQQFAVTGRVTNIFNKGLAHAPIVLLSKKPGLVIDTTTDNKGRFVFTDFPALDTPRFIIEARNKRGRDFNVGVDVDDIPSPPFTTPVQPAVMPWYINTDTTLLAQVAARQQLDKKLAEGMTLAPVVVYGRKRVEGSQNLNGEGNADMVLNAADLDKAGKKNLLTLLEENVKGWMVRTYKTTSYRYYAANYDQAVIFIFDGIRLGDIYQFTSLEELRAYLQQVSAEDIKGIEVNTSGKYLLNYREKFAPMSTLGTIAFIEITTLGGHGPIITHTPGVYYYRSKPFKWPATFYSPRYAVTDTIGTMPDYRSTIYWNPYVTTSSNGETTVSFYAADTPTTYTITIEGTDFNGNVAITTKKILVEARKK